MEKQNKLSIIRLAMNSRWCLLWLLKTDLNDNAFLSPLTLKQAKFFGLKAL